jgi:hypothetical protein
VDYRRVFIPPELPLTEIGDEFKNLYGIFFSLCIQSSNYPRSLLPISGIKPKCKDYLKVRLEEGTFLSVVIPSTLIEQATSILNEKGDVN